MVKSVAAEVKDILENSVLPKSIREINRALGYKYDSGQISVSINYWVRQGGVKAQLKDGYQRNKVYYIE